MKIRLTESKIPKININPSDVVTITSFPAGALNLLPKHIAEFQDWYWAFGNSYRDESVSSAYQKFQVVKAISPQGVLQEILVDEICEVRPLISIKITDKSYKLYSFRERDIVNFFGYDWYCASVSNEFAVFFCMGSIGKCEFSKYNTKETLYKDSEVQKILHNWLESLKKNGFHPEHFEAKIYKGKILINTLYSDDFKEITDLIDEEIKEGHWVEFTNRLNGKSMTLTPKDYED